MSIEAMKQALETCIGLDLAQKKDFAALSIVFEHEGVWHVSTRLYLNELAVQEEGAE